MHPSYITALATIALIAPAWASPAPVETIRLWNGESTVEATKEVAPRGFESPNPIALAKRDLSYSCKGSPGCKESVKIGQCDEAYGKIIDTNTYESGNGKGNTGTCGANGLGYGCGVFIEGNGCSISGQDLKTAYNAIRSHACTKCGSQKDTETKCQVTINYVTGCNG
ncbi:MAG: hypothetical protein M1830_009843 [Pleopsidium flavum]|nr:MAG: hypothetical protein M1830_003237 [Pleopsidium flavum]KAI9874359.1 MAG: hypothetical protein M1830_009843 [Pleopsidium flavum]